MHRKPALSINIGERGTAGVWWSPPLEPPSHSIVTTASTIWGAPACHALQSLPPLDSNRLEALEANHGFSVTPLNSDLVGRQTTSTSGEPRGIRHSRYVDQPIDALYVLRRIRYVVPPVM